MAFVGDRMADVAQQVKDALDAGGVQTGFMLTTSEYAELDATTMDGIPVEIRVVVRK